VTALTILWSLSSWTTLSSWIVIAFFVAGEPKIGPVLVPA
jgi:hypothetical protein